MLPGTINDLIWNLTDIKFGSLKVPFDTKYIIDDPSNPKYVEFNNPNNPQYIRFGKNVRTTIKDNILYILNKYSSDVFNTLSLNKYNVNVVLSIDVRNTDDCVLVLFKNNENHLKILVIDSETMTVTEDFLYSIEDLDSYTIRFSTIDSDMFYIWNKNEYQTRFISKPHYPAGRLEESDLYYLDNYKWGNATVKYNKFFANWGYHNDKSNTYNNITSCETVKNNKMYKLHHNIGRIYAMRQSANDRFYASVPLDVANNFDNSVCSESSFGFYFNNAISTIIRDTLNLFIKAYSSFSISERAVANKKLKDLVYASNDLYLNANETVNILAIQRIFLLINEIQSTLLPESIEN